MFKLFKKKKMKKPAGMPVAFERRKLSRVNYPPEYAATRLPVIVMKSGQLLFPENLSLEGVLLKSPPLKNAPIGNKFGFNFQWRHENSTTPVEAELLRISGSNWHFKFTSPPPKFLENFNAIMKSGIRGHSTKELKKDDIPMGQNIVELWMANTGEFVMFQKIENTEDSILISFMDQRFQHFRGKGVFLSRKSNDESMAYDTPVPLNFVDEILFYLVNLNPQTERVRELVADILHVHYIQTNENLKKNLVK